MSTSVVKQQHRRLATLFLLGGLSCYVLLSLTSFSVFDNSPLAVSSHPTTIINLGGSFGATISGILLYHLGLLSFVLPIFLMVVYTSPKKLPNICLIGQLFLCLLYGIAIYKPTFGLFGVDMPSAGTTGQQLTELVNNGLGVVGGHVVVLSVLGYLLLLVVYPRRLWLRRRRPMIHGVRRPSLKSVARGCFSVPSSSSVVTSPDYRATAKLISKTLAQFKITGKEITCWRATSVLTTYEFQPQAGIKLTQVTALADDLALALKVSSLTIVPLPAKQALGIQIPNQQRQPVYLGEVLRTTTFSKSTSMLTFAVGKDSNGSAVCHDLQTMPHLLIAGSTGSGKSMAINSLLCSILSRANAEQVRLILVDPKMLELSLYEGIPHLLRPVITDVNETYQALQWIIEEMNRRYTLMKQFDVRNIETFNNKCRKVDESSRLTEKPLPYIIFVIDELADVMLSAPKEIEQAIQRLAQKARASGIHLVLATQRPSVDIITGVIKANLPCRMAFRVTSKHDSRTILDIMGAEKLLGKGDMLFQYPGLVQPIRIQGTLVSDSEIQRLVAYLRQ